MDTIVREACSLQWLQSGVLNCFHLSYQIYPLWGVALRGSNKSRHSIRGRGRGGWSQTKKGIRTQFLWLICIMLLNVTRKSNSIKQRNKNEFLYTAFLVCTLLPLYDDSLNVYSFYIMYRLNLYYVIKCNQANNNISFCIQQFFKGGYVLDCTLLPLYDDSLNVYSFYIMVRLWMRQMRYVLFFQRRSTRVTKTERSNLSDFLVLPLITFRNVWGKLCGRYLRHQAEELWLQ